MATTPAVVIAKIVSSLTDEMFTGAPMAYSDDGSALITLPDETEIRIAVTITDRREVSRLITLAVELGVEDTALDDDVHDYASHDGTDINNGGLHSQVAYLLREAGAQEAERLIRAAG